MTWIRGLPSILTGANRNYPAQDQAFRVRVKALHHWIRRGNEDKAYLAARVVFHQAKRVLEGMSKP